MSQVICPHCGRPATSRELPKYHYKESGIPDLWLRGGVTETACRECRKTHIQIKKEGQLLQVITVGLLTDARPLTGFEMRFLRGACHMSQAQLADKLVMRRETIAEREAKPASPGIKFADEIVLRWLFIKNFREHIGIGGNNFLPEKDRMLLAGFADFFEEFSANYVKAAEDNLKKQKMVAALHGNWSLDENKRAA